MRRRGKTEAKSQKTLRRRPSKRGSKVNFATRKSAAETARLARERDDVLEQQRATAEILRVIRTSPSEVQPVFETIVRNAVSLCGSLLANVFRFDGELLHWGASHNVVPRFGDLLKAK